MRFWESFTMAGAKGTTPHLPIWPLLSKWGPQKGEKGGSGEEMTIAKILAALIKHWGQCL